MQNLSNANQIHSPKGYIFREKKLKQNIGEHKVYSFNLRFSLLSEPVHKQPGNPSGMFSQLGSAPGPVSAHPLKRSDNSPFTQIRPKEQQSLLASRRNTLVSGN